MYKVINPKKIEIDDPQARQGERHAFNMDAIKKAPSMIRKIHKKYSNLSISARYKTFMLWYDSVMAPISAESICENGCAICCNIDVTICEAEARLLSKVSGKEMCERTVAGKTPKPETATPCPFLDKATAACSVYEDRPTVCRSMMTFDSHKFCRELTTEHAIISEPIVTLLILNSVRAYTGESTAQYLQEFLSESNGFQKSTLDIRQYFPSAPAA